MADSTKYDGMNRAQIKMDIPIWMSISALSAIAWYNVIELYVQIFFTFKKRRGYYFWSLVICANGIVLHSLGFILKFWGFANVWFCTVMTTIGWYGMVTGQSFVLYSRLHLVVTSERVLRSILAMICIDIVLFQFPTTVLSFASNRAPAEDPLTRRFTRGFSIMDRIELCAFSMQEFIISGVYIYAIFRFFSPLNRGRGNPVLVHLIVVNIVIILLDVAVLTVQFMLLFTIQTALKSMVYSVKLKMEFVVLNQLKNMAAASVPAASTETVFARHRRESLRRKEVTIPGMERVTNVQTGTTIAVSDANTNRKQSDGSRLSKNRLQSLSRA